MHIEKEELNEAMDTWIKIFTDTSQTHAPIIEKKIQRNRAGIPWFTNELELKIQAKNKKLELFRLYGDRGDLKAANNITKQINHLKRKLRKKHYKEKIEQFEGDPKKMWKLLKEVTQTTPDKSTVEPEFLDQNRANQFNKFFATIGTEIQKSLGIKRLKHSAPNSPVNFEFNEETEKNIESLIHRIRIDVATG